MRLTNVTNAALPDGTVLVLDVAVGSRPLGDVPVSYNQAAHLASGDRPASWTSLVFRLAAPLEADRLAAAWATVIQRHGTLRTIARSGPGGIRISERRMRVGAWRELPGQPGASTRDIVRDALDRMCRPYSSPSHRLLLVRPPDGAADPRPAVVIAADHTHVDMWSMAVLARDLLAAASVDGDGRGAGVSADPVASYSEHTASMLAAPSAPDEVVERWRGILARGQGLLPRFPFALGDVSRPVREVVEVREVLDGAGSRRLSAAAEASGVSVLAIAVSALTEATRALGGGPFRALFPVHSRSAPPWRDAVGWMVTNSVIECAQADVAAAAAAVRSSVDLARYPLESVADAVGGFPVTRGMIALSWLDGRRLPAVPPEAEEIQFMSASLEVDGVMIWFLVGEDGLHLRCRFPGTPEAGSSVAAWLDAVVTGIRARAHEVQTASI